MLKLKQAFYNWRHVVLNLSKIVDSLSFSVRQSRYHDVLMTKAKKSPFLNLGGLFKCISRVSYSAPSLLR